MKTIVTHLGPDLDAIASIWLLKTFLREWEEAAIAFVPAGNTLNHLPPDGNPEVIHVDTGMGKYDHHQDKTDTCAALLVLALVEKRHKKDEALSRMAAVINELDHFREVFFPNPTADFWDFNLVTEIDGWRLIYADNPIEIVNLGMKCLDGIYRAFTNKIWAEKEIREAGIEFTTPWGKAVGVETTNDEVVHTGQKMGYAVVVRKDPRKGYLRIKAQPRDEIDLEKVYDKLRKDEPEATWFLHASHHMILNGSTKNPDMKPSRKSLSEVIAVFGNLNKK